MEFEDSEPCYIISVAARMLGVHVQTLRYYEREGLIEPARSRGNIRLYSMQDVDRLPRVGVRVRNPGGGAGQEPRNSEDDTCPDSTTPSPCVGRDTAGGH